MSPCVYHHRTNIPHDSSSLHHHSNRLLHTPPKKTVSHNIAPFVPSDNVSPTIFLRHRFNRPRQKNDRKKRSLAAIPDNAIQKSFRVDVSAAKKIISSFCKRPSPPPFLEATSLTTHSSSTVSNNLYRRRLQAVFPAVKKSSGAEGERYTRLRGDWLSRMSPVFQGACKEIEKRVIKRAGKTRCWIITPRIRDAWLLYVITGFSNVLCWIAWCARVFVWNDFAIGRHWVPSNGNTYAGSFC